MNLIPIGPIICATCTIVEKLIKQYKEMKLTNDICMSTLTNLKSLLDLLKAVERLDHHQPPQEVRSAINEITETFANYEKKYFKRLAKNDVEKFALSKKQEMLTMQSEVLQCTTTLNTALAVAAKAERDKEGRRQSQEERIKHMALKGV